MTYCRVLEGPGGGGGGEERGEKREKRCGLLKFTPIYSCLILIGNIRVKLAGR